MSKSIQTKQCSKCKQILPATTQYFHRHPRGKYGFRNPCKKCRRDYSKQYYSKHRTKDLQRSLKYRQTHQARLLQYKKEYLESHKAQRRQTLERYCKSLRGHLVRVWFAMLHRCKSPKNKSYKRYGGRGIKVKFVNFEDFYDYVVKELKADPRGLTIDRINNDGHYEKGNIRFITRAENVRNR